MTTLKAEGRPVYRTSLLTGEHFVGMAEQQVAMYRAAGDAAGEAVFLERYYCRMWDVSAFMHGVKQRFTQWYNGRMNRKGTLWEDRFRSVVVEGCGQVLGEVAAYIDLNPVRAGMVADPKDYRWSGYGAAMAGRRVAKEGLRKVPLGPYLRCRVRFSVTERCWGARRLWRGYFGSGGSGLASGERAERGGCVGWRAGNCSPCGICGWTRIQNSAPRTPVGLKCAAFRVATPKPSSRPCAANKESSQLSTWPDSKAPRTGALQKGKRRGPAHSKKESACKV